MKGIVRSMSGAAQFHIFFRSPTPGIRRPAETMKQRCELTAQGIGLKVHRSLRPGRLNILSRFGGDLSDRFLSKSETKERLDALGFELWTKTSLSGSGRRLLTKGASTGKLRAEP
jgi:hypothetical protein